jgi:hypothetical protein
MRHLAPLCIVVAAAFVACGGNGGTAPETSASPRATREPAAVDLATVPLAVSEQATVEQVKIAAPGTGWYCYGLQVGKEAPASAGCNRSLDECRELRQGGADAFGGGIHYTDCAPTPLAECFVFRMHADFVTLNVRAQCVGTHDGCLKAREVFGENPKTDIGGFCVPVP